MEADSSILLKSWASGGLANAFTSALLNPLDVAKTRLQSAGRGADASMVSTFKILYAQGGLVGLYRPGLTASCVREMLSSGPRAGLYVPLRDTAIAYTGRPADSPSIKIAVAMACGVVGSIIGNPVDVVKIRLMAAADSQSSPSITTAQALTSCWRNEGWRGLYRGVLPSTLRGMSIAAGELATYDIAKHSLKQELLVSDGAPLHVIASLITGAVAAVVAAPFDVAKTLAMSAVPGQPGPSLSSLVRLKGPLVLFRGLLPSYLRLGPHALISFPVFEQLRGAMGLDFV